ncbi:DUF1549 domain-containing protein [Rosistilla ulvae]|nr:DUF1549 domain-containing protein [Rosistilla ulvae]
MSDQLKISIAIVPFAAIAFLSGNAANADPSAEGIRFFEQKIRPILVEHCYECHSADSASLSAGLMVDSQQGLLEGGDSGAAIVPGKPDESLLLESLRYDPYGYQMPPNGKLPVAVIADFEQWIRDGAPDPRTETNPKPGKQSFDIDSRRSFWSFQAPKESTAPRVQQSDWPRQKIDYFILAALEKAGFQPAAEADRRTLIRRASLDLIGLPPSYEQVEQFAADPDPQAYEKLIDRLLASPHYGERWGRHWLDIVRYAEDNVNMGPHNGPYPNAFRYRDWVIGALNTNVPYDEFIRRQLATDFLDHTGPEDLPALGLLGLSPEYHKELMLSTSALEAVYADEWEDRVDVIGRGLMGITVSCARCHDHKYDPISAKDYYALAGVFASTRQTDVPIISQEAILASQPARDEIAALKKQMAEIDAELKANKGDRAAIASLQKKRRSFVQKIAQIRAATPNIDIPMAAAVTEAQVRIEPKTETHQKIVYHDNKPRDLPVFIRGNVTTPGEIVPRRFLEVLSTGEPQPFQTGSGRLDLADAIASTENPLTSRVFVNRVWLLHFGEGLVDTPSNFGATGSAASHPLLLDDLAARFMRDGWSIKDLHREMMLSATYRQSSFPSAPDNVRQLDPGNRLLSHFRRMRLDAEAYHDALLVAGGSLDPQLGGRSKDIDNADYDRRAVYATISRQSPSQYLQVHDFPDPTIHAERRGNTTTALQQLFTMNSPFVLKQAQRLSKRVQASSDRKRIVEVYRLLFAREPTTNELSAGIAYLSQKAGAPQKEQIAALPSFVGDRIHADTAKLGESYSVEFWFRNTVPYAKRPVAGYLFSRGVDSSIPIGGDHIGIVGSYRSEQAGRLLFFNGARQPTSLVGRTTLQLDHWHHLVFVRDGSEVRLHLDGQGEPEVTGNASVSFDPAASQLFVGGRNDRFANFLGKIGGVAVYDRKLSISEIAQHFQLSGQQGDSVQFADHFAAMLQSQPVAAWALHEHASLPTQLQDRSGNERHATYEGKVSLDDEFSNWVAYCHALLCSNELLFVN